MSKRISYSLLDPWLSLPIKKQYHHLRIPAGFPPEGIVLIGHLSAILGAVGLAYATTYWWGGLLAACGIAGNHIADLFDGTHARATGQCRHGGELLDHFTDPLSFAYWMVGIAVSCGRLDLGIVAVIGLYALALLTSIKAKLIGEFTLAACGPTEFKTLLVCYGLLLCLITTGWWPVVALAPVTVALWFYLLLIAVGLTQLVLQLYQAVQEVNLKGGEVDSSEWITVRSEEPQPEPNKNCSHEPEIKLIKLSHAEAQKSQSSVAEST